MLQCWVIVSVYIWYLGASTNIQHYHGEAEVVKRGFAISFDSTYLILVRSARGTWCAHSVPDSDVV